MKIQSFITTVTATLQKMFHKIYFMIELLIGVLFSMMNIYQQV